MSTYKKMIHCRVTPTTSKHINIYFGNVLNQDECGMLLNFSQETTTKLQQKIKFKNIMNY